MLLRRPRAGILFFLVIMGMVGMVFAAACGGDNADSDPTSEPGAPTEAASPGSAASPTAAEATELTVTHYSGTDTVPLNPETVVVFDLGIFISLHSLGIEVDALGGLGTPVPAAYEEAVNDPNLANVGTAFEPDYEAVNALEPDLIIVAHRSSATYAEMSKIAPTIDLTMDWENYAASFREVHETLGQIFGVEDAVAAELERLEAEAAEVGEQGPGAGSALVVMTSGAEVSAYGPGSRFGMIHSLFGYPAADESLERDATHGDVISFEFILEAAPEVLFVVDRSAAVGEEADGAEVILDNALVAETPAWTNDRVVYVDNFAWYIAFNSLPAYEQMIADAHAGLG